MILCEHCEDNNCLEINSEKSFIEQDCSGDLALWETHFECRETGCTGMYRWVGGVEITRGIVLTTDEQPRTIADEKRGECDV